MDLGALCWYSGLVFLPWQYILTHYPGIIAPNHLMILSCIWNSRSRKGILRLSFYHKTFNQLQSAGNPKTSRLLFELFWPFLSCSVYPGQEFNSSGLKTFERTSFQNVLSGVYRSVVLSAASASPTDAQLFCRQTCSRDSCCDGFILSQMALDGGIVELQNKKFCSRKPTLTE